MACRHVLPYSLIRANKWSGITAITANVARGKRQKAGNDDALPCILESQGDEKTFRRNWVHLIQKIGACPGEGREHKKGDGSIYF
jgi:hypothetical protein